VAVAVELRHAELGRALDKKTPRSGNADDDRVLLLIDPLGGGESSCLVSVAFQGATRKRTLANVSHAGVVSAPLNAPSCKNERAMDRKAVDRSVSFVDCALEVCPGWIRYHRDIGLSTNWRKRDRENR
jgi:hypothetical protein